MMDLEGHHAYCMFISIGIFLLEIMSANTYSMMMSANALSMMMKVFMRRMTLWGFVDLWTLLQISLTRESRGCASALGIHICTCKSYVGKYYTFNCPRLKVTPVMLDIASKS